jgi:hypothetical protein
MKALARKLLLWSWVISVPVLLIGGYVGYRAIDRFATFALRYDNVPVAFNLDLAIRYEVALIRQRTRAAIQRVSGNDPRRTALKTIQLFVSEANLAKLNAQLPHSGFDYVKASLADGGRLLKAKVRYRGDFLYHWAWEKKSLRVKTSKKRLFEGIRSFNLIAPKNTEQLNNFLGYRLAQMMGLLAPRTELTRVILNGQDHGIHLLVEQFNETALRRLGRMPADIYRGEMIAKDIQRDSHVTNLFESAAVWDKVSVNNHYDPASMAPLQRLLSLTAARGTRSAQLRLGDHMDLEAWGRFSAFETLAATFHYAYNHNWRMYYDPWRQKMLPIVWDPVGWGATWYPGAGGKSHLDMVNTDLHRMLFRNGDFLRARQRAFEDFFASGKAVRFLDLVERTVPTMEREVRSDPFLKPGDPDHVIRAMRRMRTYIHAVFKDVKAEFVNADMRAVYAPTSNGIRLRLQGRKPLWRLRLEFDRALPSLSGLRVNYTGPDGNLTTADMDAVSALKGNTLTIEAGFLSDMVARSEDYQDVDVQPGTYDIELQSAEFNAARLLSVSASAPTSALTSAPTSEGERWKPLLRLDSLPQLPFSATFQPVKDHPLRLPEIWRDEIIVEATRIIDHPLVIEPGTTIRMAPGTSLILKDRLIARGTSSKPVKFLPKTPGQQPWGTVALQGPNASGSRLTHCAFVGGSGAKDPLMEYSAMFSVHDARDIEIRSCHFRDSKLVDDMLHTVYASISIKDSTFSDAPHDAIDLDISEAIIRDSVFRDNGNDAVDLMTSQAHIANTTLSRSGDKGVSVGEGSQLRAVDTRFEGNKIAVQAKDGSIAALLNVDIIANQVGLDAYRKNWRYGDGGTILVAKSRLSGNTRAIGADKRSEIQVFDSFIDSEIHPAKNLRLDDNDARDSELAATSEMLPPASTLSPKLRAALKMITRDKALLGDAKRRGARLKDGRNGD